MSIFIGVTPFALDLVLEKRNIGLVKGPNNEQGEKNPLPGGKRGRHGRHHGWCGRKCKMGCSNTLELGCW